MNTSKANKVSSKTAILKTIENDSIICQWFCFLILIREIRKELSKDPELKHLYKKLKSTRFYQRATILLGILALALLILTQQYYSIILIIILFFLFYKMRLAKINYIKEISSSLISSHFDEEKESTITLFQLGEFFSQKYSMPSIVDNLYIQDKLTASALIISFFLVTFIVECTIIQAFLFMGFVYCLVYIFSNSFLIIKINKNLQKPSLNQQSSEK